MMFSKSTQTELGEQQWKILVQEVDRRSLIIENKRLIIMNDEPIIDQKQTVQEIDKRDNESSQDDDLVYPLSMKNNMLSLEQNPTYAGGEETFRSAF